MSHTAIPEPFLGLTLSLLSQELCVLYKDLCERTGADRDEEYQEKITEQVARGEAQKGEGIPYPVFSRLICGPLWKVA